MPPTRERETLEENSLWYEYKTRVWPQDDPMGSGNFPNGTPHEAITVHNIMRTLRGIHNSRRLAYVTVPINSGLEMYRMKLEKGDRLNDELIDLVIRRNYQSGWELVESLKTRIDFPVIFPADLTPAHQTWDQDHFQALWLSIIAEKCTDHILAKDWAYSNGGVEEFTHTWQLRLGIPRSDRLIFYNSKDGETKSRERMKGIRVHDHLGNPITIETGIEEITKALNWINTNGFEAPRIERCLSLLGWTRKRIEEGFYQ